MPKIAFKKGGTLIATFEESIPKAGTEWGISLFKYLVSKDGGKTWTKSKDVFTNRYKESQPNFSGLATLGDGEVGAVWLDNNPDSTIVKRPVWFAKTLPGGGFGDAVKITNAVCECCRVALSGDKDGIIDIVFRDFQDGNLRDISMHNLRTTA